MTVFGILHIRANADLVLGPEYSVTTLDACDLNDPVSRQAFDAIVVDDPRVTDLALLRSAPDDKTTPIFLNSQDAKDHPLADGGLPDDLATVLTKARARQDKNALLQDQSSEAVVLSWLWHLDTRTVAPVIDLSRPEIYRYPVLDMLGVEAANTWLVRACQRELIIPISVIDRTRNCATCASAHLNYVDRCPYCDALDIKREQAIHCFTCGFVGEQGLFRRAERLICPKCDTALKHIGTDYDRPIERMRCCGCGERFNDPRIKATCLECGTINAQTDLQTHTFRSYGLGPAGEALLKGGRSPEDQVRAFGEAVGPEQFLWTLSWLNSMARSNSVVARVDILDQPEVSDQDRARTQSLRDQIGSLLPETAVLHYRDPNTIMVLFPEQGQDQTKEFVQRIKSIGDAQKNSPLKLTVDAITLPQPRIGPDARGWLDRFADKAN